MSLKQQIEEVVKREMDRWDHDDDPEQYEVCGDFEERIYRKGHYESGLRDGLKLGIEIGRREKRELQKVAVENLQPGRVYRVRATEEADGEVLVLRFIGLRKPSKKGNPEPAFFGFNQRGPSFLDMSVVEGIYGPLEINLPSPSAVFGGGA